MNWVLSKIINTEIDRVLAYAEPHLFLYILTILQWHIHASRHILHFRFIRLDLSAGFGKLIMKSY